MIGEAIVACVTSMSGQDGSSTVGEFLTLDG